MTLKALIFDVDGTLAETEELHRRSFNQAFTDFGLEWHWGKDLYQKLLAVTGGRERIRYFVDDYSPSPKNNMSDEEVQALHRHKTAVYCDKIDKGDIALRPGVARLILQAREQGVRLAIGTTTSRVNVDRLLKTTFGPESVGWFEAFATGDRVVHKKPAPDIFRLALTDLGLAARECLAVEDSAQGLASARGAGIPTLITVSQYSKTQHFDNAVAVISSLGEEGAPFAVLGGLAKYEGIVDLSLLRCWHREFCKQAFPV